MDKLYIVIPAYNEEATINQVIDDWYPVVENSGEESKLVIIDDGSKDGTYRKLKTHSRYFEFLAYNRINVIRQRNRGKGGA